MLFRSQLVVAALSPPPLGSNNTPQEPYGCHDELLQKRLRRDPFAVGPPHASRCPALRELLAHCESTPFAGPLPWAGKWADGGGET